MKSLVLVLAVGACLYTHDRKCETPGYPPEREIDLFDPENLYCLPFTAPGCDEDCGPCVDPVGLPTWGSCESSCLELGPGACEATSGCRVIRYLSSYYDQEMLPGDSSFYGCAPVDTVRGSAPSCDGLDAVECSRYDTCVYLATFAVGAPECIPEDQHAGRCDGMVTCGTPPPACEEGRTPGIEDGCYTGSCIPIAYCL